VVKAPREHAALVVEENVLPDAAADVKVMEFTSTRY
jgi:hypothetical protein